MAESRALLLAEYFPPVVGGAARKFEFIVENARRFRWTVITQPVPDAAEVEQFGPHQILRPPFWRVPPSFLKWRTAYVYARLRRFSKEVIRRDNPEVLHAGPAYGAAFIGATMSVPLVTHVFGEEFSMQGRSAYRRRIMRHVFSRSAAIIGESDMAREEARKLGGKNTLQAIFTDLKRFHPAPREKRETPKLITVGRIVERKGHDLVIKALQSLPDIFYHIAGEGPYRRALEDLSKRLGVADRVRFIGKIADADLPAFYSSGDLFVMPNRELPSGEREGFGLVFMEAAACGIPSIGGQSGGAGTAIEDGVTGFLVDPHDHNILAREIRRLLDNRPLLEKMGRAARERAVTICDVERNIEIIENAHRS